MSKKHWYVVHVHSGTENKVAEAIREQAVRKGLAEYIEDVLVPTEQVVEIKKGEKVTSDDINKYGIDLRGPVRLTFDKDKKKSFYFIGYLLVEISNTEYKIKPHELLFG